MTIRTETPPVDLFAAKAETTLRVPSAATTDELVLANGTRFRFRPVGVDDGGRLAELFARLSPESRRRRFLSPKPALTPRELAFLTDIDHVGHEAIAAVDQRDGSFGGVARYVRVAGRVEVAEVAIEVADELQRMGIGTQLAERIVRRARANGCSILAATTLWENRPARALLRRLQFRARASHGREIEFDLDLDLTIPAGAPASTRPLPEQPNVGP